MEKHTLDNIFKNLEHNFDTETPNTGHKTRFLNKLNNQNNIALKSKKNNNNFWKPFIAIAASVAILITLFTITPQTNSQYDLANVSPKMAETQDFFTAAINEELQKLKKESLPEAKNLIQDALKQIQILETNYQSLKIDLNESGEDNRVIYAMISNFQNRIDILKDTLTQIENIKQLKSSLNQEISELNM